MIEIKEALRFHCGQMARRMRRQHLELILAAGVDPHRELLTRWRRSCVRRVAFIDDKLSAMWGLSGLLLGDVGEVWVVLTEEASRHPMPVIRQAKREIAEFASQKAELETKVLLDDPGAIRLAAVLGFHLQDDGPGARAHDREGRARLIGAAHAGVGRHGEIAGLRFAVVGYHQIPAQAP